MRASTVRPRRPPLAAQARTGSRRPEARALFAAALASASPVCKTGRGGGLPTGHRQAIQRVLTGMVVGEPRMHLTGYYGLISGLWGIMSRSPRDRAVRPRGGSLGGNMKTKTNVRSGFGDCLDGSKKI